MKNLKKFTIIMLALAVISGGIFAYQYFSTKANNTEPTDQIGVLSRSWKTYTNTQFGFEIKYPQDYKVKDGWLYKSGFELEPDIFISVDKEPHTLAFQGTWVPILYSEAGSANLIYSENVVINNITFEKDYWLLRAAGGKYWFADVSFNTKYNNKYYTIYGGVGINISGIPNEPDTGYNGSQVTDKNIINTALNDMRNTEKNILLDQMISTFKFIPAGTVQLSDTAIISAINKLTKIED